MAMATQLTSYERVRTHTHADSPEHGSV